MSERAPASPLPAQQCPLCGGSNECVPAACGRFDVECWCSDVHFGPELLARVPEQDLGRACICARCAAAARLGD